MGAVGHDNRPLGTRGLEGFFMHMHTAWLYLLLAEFKRDRVDYRYWDALEFIAAKAPSDSLQRCAWAAGYGQVREVQHAVDTA